MKEQNKKGYEILRHCPSDCAQPVPVRVIDLIIGYSDIIPTKFTIRDIDFTNDDDLYKNIYFALYNDWIEKYDVVYIPKEEYKEIPEITEKYENCTNNELYDVIKERLNDVIRKVNSMNNKE